MATARRARRAASTSEDRTIDVLVAGNPPDSPSLLHAWIRRVLGAHVPRRTMTRGSSAPFAYLLHTYFEGRVPSEHPEDDPPAPIDAAPADAVVWAARGAGKTFLGAIATALDLVFKAGIEIRILGGSLEQSQRMHEHLRRLFDRPHMTKLLAAPVNEKRIVLKNGSRAQILAQSQTSVRGTRVQKLRCDEVELFDPEVWHAAQLTTRSAPISGPWGPDVRGSVEALSTMHLPHGLMWNLVAEAAGGSQPDTPPSARPREVFRWGIIDVLARCDDTHACEGCSLRPECKGRAKRRRRDPGHLVIGDVVRMKSRVSLEAWRSEMLCERPRRSHCVFPEFDAQVHVGAWAPTPDPAPLQSSHTGPAFDAVPAPASSRRWVAGMDFGIRAPTVALLAWFRADDPEMVLYIEAEHVQSDWTIARHASVLLAGGVPGWPVPSPQIDWVGVDPAGHQRSDQTGYSSIAALRKAGLCVHSRRLPLHDGLEVLRARLRPAAGAGSPRILIHERCRVLIESLSKYHYPEDRPQALDPVKDGSDHAVDALRYLVITLDKPHTAHVREY